MPEYLERMVKEADELAEHVKKLGVFVAGTVFNSLTDYQQTLVNAQLGAMTAYLSILNLRILNLRIQNEMETL